MNALGYLFGVLLHIGFKWSSWKRKDRPWLSYWREYAGLNISAAIAAFVCFGLWEIGWLAAFFSGIGRFIYAAAGSDEPAPALPITPWTSLFAGYILDSVARTVTMKFQTFLSARTPPPEGGGS